MFGSFGEMKVIHKHHMLCHWLPSYWNFIKSQPVWWEVREAGVSYWGPAFWKRGQALQSGKGAGPPLCCICCWLSQ